MGICKIHCFQTILISFTLTFLLSNCTNLPNKIEEKPSDKFRKDFWIKSEYALAEDYHIKVLLPGSYFTSDKKYPVLYLTDADFFFGIASDMAYHLELNQKEIVLVGISYDSRKDAWEKRGKDFLADDFNTDDTPGYALFLSFLEKELIPEIETKFRAESSNRTLFGWSSGFYFVCHTLYENRTLFDNYILGGGLFPKKWSEEMKLGDRAKLRQEKTDRPISIYAANPEFDAPEEKFLASVESLKQQNFAELLLKVEILKGHQNL